MPDETEFDDNIQEPKKEEECREIVIRPGDALDTDEIFSKYVAADATCICCNVPKLSLKVNKAYLDGMTYTAIIEKYSEEFKAKVGCGLHHRLLSTHFTKHFNSYGVAVAEYNRKFGISNLPLQERKEMGNIFDALVANRINDIELLDLSMKEQIKRLQELEDLKTERIKEKRTFQLDNLIMKQEMVMNNLQTQILSKLKIWQKAQVDSKQIEIMDRQLQFLDHKTASFLGIELQNIEPSMAKEAEKVYLRVVLNNIMAKLKSSIQLALKLSQQDTAQLFKELERQFKGLEKDVNTEFQEKLKNIRRV